MAKRSSSKKTPVQFWGSSVYPDQMKNFMEEWSLRQAEENHVESIEEANDFNIQDEEDEDFFQGYTVYEMHEIAEDNLAAYQAALPQDPEVAESSESDDRALATPDNEHDQSAPVEPDSLPSEKPRQIVQHR